MTQKQIIENHDLSHALYEELEALKIRIAFAEIGEEELAEFDQGLASASELDYSEDAQKKALKAIQRKLDKQTRRRFIQKTLPRTFNAIFAVLLVFFIGLTTATATVRSFRL
ncbi:MAG: hypothetical protein IJ769_02700, partial [Clostridia bacterium]|nr:hypothetical protein [Clostridia bacterium]